MPSRQMVFETGQSNIKRSRSRFDLSHKNTFTMVAGKLYPFDCYTDVIAGDTHIVDMSLLCRSTTPITAVMDDSYIQCEFWWVPNQLVLSRASMSPSVLDAEHSWKAFFGAQENLLNVGLLDNDDPMLPVLRYKNEKTYANYLGSLAHYLDYPFVNDTAVNVATAAAGKRDNIFFNPFAMLAFYQVWSDAYREPNLWNPVTYSISAVGSINYISFTRNEHAGIEDSDDIYANKMPDVCREHGYFGSALPWPQRNLNPVQINLMEALPLTTGDFYSIKNKDTGTQGWIGIGSSLNTSSSYMYPLYSRGVGSDTAHDFLYTSGDPVSVSGSDPGLDRTNLYADLSKVGSVTINTLRYSFALQAYYEALGRMGNRYDDIIRMYGVTIDKCDACHSEYLGGKRIPLNQAQIVASAQGSTKPIGSIGGFSNTSDFDHYFTKSFTDFGSIVGVCFIRHHDTFHNRLSRERSRVSKFDYWNPYFARIGETPIYRNELFVNYDSDYRYGASVTADFVDNPEFGFQEYGADYRYREDTIHGLVTPGQSYGYWTYATNWFDIMDALEGGIAELSLGNFLDGSLQRYSIDQTLEVSAATAGFQFVVQVYLKWTAIRNISAHSVPAVLGQR